MMNQKSQNDDKSVNKVTIARQRHGKPFAYESGSNWKPRSVPLLTEWLQGRGREEAK
ncbi:hypothetical protein UFOVP938_41 [uncultured Caudovirales phage]|uniref:Uncharacterized protein n=1 Tax=uncultured Caudovirales phage TaxID=2100421 RepID=A0A6J5QIU5_9CAUD|nr:hypothetical protein UFOVP596_3 [uncultured Caudovirales phage]CAB4172660.1 hypothetical protein UFOVP938_41 [uncultured Caudovirales phage]CAB4183672.1 hypothetical protein UFOVP1104_60 [uncultured Caudovirales phage]CAB4202395.1 hypothetical protein UFOVP1371_12 [uncultured Caudovirales phage]CAB4214759.1 hypothetical protein UFOVP1468_20 [uncultured Caudovirales phage]